jgi:hypothetical protein
LLAELQRAFSEQVLRGDARAGVYVKTVLGALIGALESTFPACHATVGERFFAAMAGRYVRATPSRSPSLDDFGEDFADFIAGFGPARELPYLSDLARFEWARHACAIAADSHGLDPARLAAVPEEARSEVRFELAPGLALVESAWPVDAIFELAESPSHPPVDLDAGGVCLLVFRDGPATMHQALAPAEAELIRRIRDGASFGEIWTALEDDDPVALLGRALRAGWITGLV